MAQPGHSLSAFREHYSEEPDISVKIEKDEFIPETLGEEPCPCPEDGPTKEEYLINPLNLAKNGTEQMEKFHEPVKVENEELMEEPYNKTSYSYSAGSGLVKDEYLITSLDLPKRSSAQQEEPDFSVKIEKEEFVQESYGEELCPCPELGAAKEDHFINPINLPKNDIEQIEETLCKNWDCSSSKLKTQKKMTRMLLNDSHLQTGKKSFACEFCNSKFRYRGGLEGHLRTHTGEKPFVCDSCSARFTEKGHLINHVRTHTGEKPFGCSSCSVRFANRSSLAHHIRTHAGEKSFRCDSCSARFTIKGNLVRHIRTHTGEKSFGCDSCSARFTRKCNLVMHIQTHTGEKPFECDYCSARFTQKISLVKHIRTHTGEKPFGCDSCSARFAQKGQLVDHTRTHTGEKPFGCDFCSAIFAKKKSLVDHIRLHTNKGNSCST